jgi:tetratricopeptide (TPR) repeat protein
LESTPTRWPISARRALNPSYAATHQSLATTLALLGQFEEAVIHYDAALALRPDDVDAHNNVAVLLARLGRPEAAEAHYRQALRLRPNDVETRSNFAALMARLGRDEEAISEFVTVLDARPSHDPALRGLAGLATRRPDSSGLAALDHLRAALGTADDDPSRRRYYVGLALAELGRLDDAAKQFEAVLRLRPDDQAAARALDSIRRRRIREDRPRRSGPLRSAPSIVLHKAMCNSSNSRRGRWRRTWRSTTS